MLGIGLRLLLLALGGLAGYGFARGVTFDDVTSLLARLQPALAEDEARDAASTSAPVELSAKPVTRPEVHCDPLPETVASAAAPGLSSQSPAGNTRSRTDVASWAASRDPQTPAEWYLAFTSERRDDERAGPAEERIAELILESPTPGLRTEYLRCATRFCTIAGYVNASSTFDSCAIGDWIGGAAVFRGNLRYSCVDEEFDGRRRFVVFIDTAPVS